MSRWRLHGRLHWERGRLHWRLNRSTRRLRSRRGRASGGSRAHGRRNACARCADREERSDGGSQRRDRVALSIERDELKMLLGVADGRLDGVERRPAGRIERNDLQVFFGRAKCVEDTSRKSDSACSRAHRAFNESERLGRVGGGSQNLDRSTLR